LIGRRPQLTELLDIFWMDWHARDQGAIRYPRGEDINTVARQAERLLRAFQLSDWAVPGGTIIGVEEEVRGRLAPDLPEILARLDLIVETEDCVTVTDFKSARGAWSQDHVRDAAEQLLLYHELAMPLAGGKPIRLQFAVLTKTKVPELALHEVRPEPRQLRRTRLIVERVWQAIQSGSIYPSPSPINCPSCPYREPCRAWTG
ncbi:MAG: PD-(D/E)XK nuclease family protein, partial [Gemmataceae bacterium]